ncbi:hypothetical protein, partial [Pseudomonas syringae group genomosp. 7]|uniref:hypothetical protein n=1 Tax=Pseudomonas syringae group genomosp. 7 TaxID=251699 RepID=UPI003770523B
FLIRRSGLGRELRGTGCKTGRLNTPDKTKVAGSGAASQPFAEKSAPTLSGKKRVMCTDRATLRMTAICRYFDSCTVEDFQA